MTDIYESQQGLSQKEVNDRIQRGLTNKTDIKVSKNIFQIFISNICTYFNLIFALLAVFIITTFTGDWSIITQLTFLGIVIVNTIIGIVQELQAKRVLDKMNLLNAPQTTVIREGKESVIPSDELVKGDLIVLTVGNSIPADGRLISGVISVNESLLTGEEHDVPKKIGDDLFSGCFVVSGTGMAVLEEVGNNSFIAKLSMEAKKMKRTESSEMIRSVNTLLKGIGIIIIPMAIFLFINAFILNKENYTESVYSTAGAITAMIPEGLYLLMTIVLAAGTVRLANQRVLLHEMKSIESLARVDVLCVDKTGTITQPKMQVSEIVSLSKDAEKQLALYVRDAVDQNNTMDALKAYFSEKITEGAAAVNVIPFSSSVKFGVISYPSSSLLLGAPEFVLKKELSTFQKLTEQYTSQGDRVLVLAEQTEVYTEGIEAPSRKAIAAIVFNNALRENAVETFKYFNKEGVTIKVISGDNPVTVSAVAKRAGIINAEKYIDATTLQTDDQIADAVAQNAVFGRVTPVQKQKMVLALKKQGHTVAMTGDGVNDILAMKDADCSIAMASGSEAASQAAQVVLLDSDFSCMPNVVLEGRRAINNLQRSAILFLSKNTFSLLLSLITLIMAFSTIPFMFPLTPSNIMLISVFTIGLPGMLLAFEANHNRIKGHFMKTVLLRALPAGITSTLSVLTVTLLSTAYDVPREFIGTIATVILAAVGFMILRQICTPFTKYRLFVYIFSILSIIGTGLTLPFLFGLVFPDISVIPDLLPPLLIIIVVAEIIFFIVSKIIDKKLR